MSDISRRKYLSVTAALGITGLSGCVSDALPSFNEEDTKNEHTEITGVRVRETPDGYNQEADNFVVVSDNLQSEYNIGRHEQIRLRIQADDMEQWRLRPAVFTTKVEPDFTSDEEDTIWLSSNGMERIFAEPEMIISVLPYATSPLIDTKNEAQSNNDFIEQSITKQEELLACASSGGDIYENTHLQALHISSESKASSWVSLGYDDRDRAFERWEVDPTLLNPKSYNDVRFLIEDENFNNAVNFIGIPNDHTGRIVIGGLAPSSLQERIKSNIESAFEGVPKQVSVEISESGEYAGTDARNIVNRFSDDGSNGIQIAQSVDIHTDYWKPVAEAVLEVFNGEDQDEEDA